MLICPKCKTEYIDGTELCVDCKVELVKEDELDSYIEWVVLAKGEKELLEELAEFLEYSNINQVDLLEDEDNDTWILNVDSKDFKEANKLFVVFRSSKEPEINPEEEEQKEVKYSSYIDEEAKIKDLKSSATAFLSVGILGFAALILNVLGIYDFSLDDTMKYVFYTVMFGITGGFIFIGIKTLKDVKTTKEKAEVSSNQREIITNWFVDKYNANDIDNNINQEETEEAKYFARFEYIKSRIAEEFVELEEGYLDNLVEELYVRVYES